MTHSRVTVQSLQQKPRDDLVTMASSLGWGLVTSCDQPPHGAVVTHNNWPVTRERAIQGKYNIGRRGRGAGTLSTTRRQTTRNAGTIPRERYAVQLTFFSGQVTGETRCTRCIHCFRNQSIRGDTSGTSRTASARIHGKAPRDALQERLGPWSSLAPPPLPLLRLGGALLVVEYSRPGICFLLSAAC